MTADRVSTLADVALPRSDRVASAALVASATLLTALAAQIAIPVPWSPVPLTGQTFAVVLSGLLLGFRRGACAQVLYVLGGAAGLPFFAAGAFGLGIIAGPTAGYLLAFPLAAGLTGWLAERGWDRRFSTTLAAMLLGSGLILACGLAALSRFVPASLLLQSGLWPFVPGDVVKAILAALALPRAWRGVTKDAWRPRDAH